MKRFFFLLHNMQPLRFRVVLCLGLMLNVSAFASDAQLSILINNVNLVKLDLSSHIELFLDESDALTLEEITTQADDSFRPADEYRHLLPLGEHTFWMRVRLRESAAVALLAQKWKLVVESTELRGSELYFKDESGFQRIIAGDGRHLEYSVPIDPDKATEVYFKTKVIGAFNLPVTLWNAEAYQLYKRKTLPAWGLFFGGLLALILYNLFLSVSLSEGTYFYLAAFLVSSTLVAASGEGFFSRYSFEFAFMQTFNFSAYIQCLALVCAVAFTRSYLGTKIDYPLMDRMLLGAALGALLLALFVAVGVLNQPLFVLLFIACSALFFVPAIVACLNVSQRATRYFLAGWSVFMLGYVIFQLSEIGIIPVNGFTIRFKEVALCFLGITLSLGIAARIQRERFEKRKDVSLQNDTMLELKYAEEQLQKKVLRDTLHHFPELDVLAGVAQKMIASRASDEESVTLVLVELHHLIQVENHLGHAAKNELLTRATKRLSIILRSIAGVVPLSEFKDQYAPMAVMGNGEYAFLLQSMDDCAVNIAVEEVESAMQRPFFYQGVALQSGVSFGVSKLSEVVTQFNGLLEQSLTALSADKTKNLSKGYHLETVNQYNPRNISLINELRASIQDDQLALYFQAIYDLRSNKVCGIEVLVRWNSALEHSVNPSEIFYLAEVGGFVSELTLKMIDKAIHHYLVAVDPHQTPLKLSISLSPKCLRESGFIEEVGFLLQKNHIPAQVLSFEIKEAAIIEDPNITREVLNRIRATGIGLTIDEFGVSYGKPSYMSNLPVTEVKLDQRLIGNLDSHYDRESLTEIVTLCRAQDIKLVVHGIEDETAFAKLEKLGCCFAQGHYLAAPVKAADFRLPRYRNKKQVQH
ncbi:EAL domain-containing protein [Ketobacter sp.]|nr:MAG: EAL domain-containing protein [Ketobacter sp.]